MNLDSIFTLLNDVSLFYSYVREDVPFVKQLSDTSQNFLIIAPTNEAIARLGKKPWGFPRDITFLEREGGSEKDIDIAIQRNIIDFVGSHVAIFDNDYSPSKDEQGYAIFRSVAMEDGNTSETGGAGDIVLKNKSGFFFVASTRNAKFNEVKSMEIGVNGVILVIDSCLTWPDL